MINHAVKRYERIFHVFTEIKGSSFKRLCTGRLQLLATLEKLNYNDKQKSSDCQGVEDGAEMNGWSPRDFKMVNLFCKTIGWTEGNMNLLYRVDGFGEDESIEL